MKNWLDTMAGMEDDYLIGLSNKGIVKRAYKDREQTRCEVGELLEEIQVRVETETCVIRLPLGESTCSCLSRSICKHIILAILAVREVCRQKGADKTEEQKSEAAEEETTEQSQPSAFPEIDSCPVRQMVKIMGNRKYLSFMNQVKSGRTPAIEITSIITVRLPDSEWTVRLLEPVQYSTCTCHKKDWCEHKAEAVLWYQLQKGFIQAAELQQYLEEPQEINLEQIHAVARDLTAYLTVQLGTGLSRMSQDVTDSMERMAVVSHSHGLAECERQFRALAEGYRQYFKRAVAFQTETLMEQFMRLLNRVTLLSKTEQASQVLRLAGEFKSEYQPAGELLLTGVGVREFKSKSGYEGETYYFLEERSGKWYTYSQARPVFYENANQRKPPSGNQSPWNLEVGVKEVPNLNLRLVCAKTNKRRRISSSQETRAEILGKRSLRWEVLKPWYFRDFGLLFQEQKKVSAAQWLSGTGEEEYDAVDSQNLWFVQATSVGETVFDSINQIFRLPLYDQEKRIVRIEVLYSKNEAFTIRYLERVVRRIQEGGKSIPCFVGSVYVKDGELKMNPIACLEQGELKIPEEEAFPEEKIKNKETEPQNVERKDEIRVTNPEEWMDQDSYQVMETLRSQAVQLMTQLFQSGFDTVHDSTLEELYRSSRLFRQYGLFGLAEPMGELVNQLRSQRHQMKQDYGKQAALFETIMEYLFFLKDLLEKDRAAQHYGRNR